jgi:protein-S-isoprenylcysteine O-methyltransferase Ste14
MTRMHSIFILTLLWTAWCFLHSLLISRGFAAGIKSIMGGHFGYYRIAYNIFSFFSLVPVIYFQLHLEEKVIFAWPWPLAIVKYSMYAGAMLLFYGGLRVYDLQYMLGLKQIREQGPGNKTGATELTRRGILGYVRHPWYSGTILLIWAFGDITDVSLVSKVVLTLYVIIGTLLEEKKLIAEFGEKYLAYREQVGMFIPWKKG